MKKISKGFTLIEMLIVITIIALLASLILVGMGGARAKTRDARRIADLHNVMNALELYYAKNYYYPDESDWTGLTTALTTGNVGIHRIPQDPLNTSPTAKSYYYGVSTDGQDYGLGADLETVDPSLNNDIDGVLHGISCDDPAYCIRP
jgi:prepilin-type N-terminal cleavage/methylation domain-containing protein